MGKPGWMEGREALACKLVTGEREEGETWEGMIRHPSACLHRCRSQTIPVLRTREILENDANLLNPTTESSFAEFTSMKTCTPAMKAKETAHEMIQ